MADEIDTPPSEGPAAIGAVAAVSALKKPEIVRAAKWVGVGIGIGSAAVAAALLYSRQRGKSDDKKVGG